MDIWCNQSIDEKEIIFCLSFWLISTFHADIEILTFNIWMYFYSVIRKMTNHPSKNRNLPYVRRTLTLFRILFLSLPTDVSWIESDNAMTIKV